ncbi:MAG: RecQ family ATP-dependent DNA helicase [Rhodothermaceae bacterium]|nr:RecQ family ATP-dependent DNA helicase [Rhodothermaceae bacterium]
MDPLLPSRFDRTTAEAVLQKHWGHAAFRAGQWEAIEAVLAGRDGLAVLPTGGGKSVLYQLPAVLREGLVLVVSPLIALMHDQVASLHARHIPAAAMTGALGYRAIDQMWTDAEFGRYRLLYVTPERLQSDLFLARAERLPVSLLAVDEAHCISEWGHDFRPAYRRIAEARPLLSDADGRPAPVLAVTATATPAVRRDIVDQLKLENPAVVVRGFDRPNLVWAVYREEDKARKLTEIVRAVPGSGLAYAGTRAATEAWAEVLRNAGATAEAYHAGLDADTRTAIQQRWLAGTTRYLAATSAFGMGIDKPDVRVVVHVAVPPTLEAYYQEAGRAGRDGRRAWAVLLFTEGDADWPRAMAEEGHPDAKTVQAVYAAAGNLAQVPLGSAPADPIPLDPEALASVAGATPMAVRAAVDRLAEAEAWQVLRPRTHHAFIQAEQPPEAIRHYADSLGNAALASFTRSVLRLLPVEAFHGGADVDLRPLEGKTGVSRERLLAGFAFLAEHGLLSVQPPSEGVRVVFNGPRVEKAALDATALVRHRRRAQRHLSDMLSYICGLGCRRQHLLRYFGETASARCGQCDVCLGRHRLAEILPDDEPHLRRLLDHVEQGDPRADWLREEGVRPHRRDALADWLVHEGYLRLADPLTDAFELTPKALRFRQKAGM